MLLGDRHGFCCGKHPDVGMRRHGRLPALASGNAQQAGREILNERVISIITNIHEMTSVSL